MAVDVRPARDARELAAAIDVLRSAGLGMSVGRLLEFPSRSSCGDVLVAVRRGSVVGGAGVVGFGATGWIGALGVSSRERRRGIGTALTTASTAWLRERGARTVLLYATPAGLTVYRRAGFAEHGEAIAWRDSAPPRGPGDAAAVRRMEPADLVAVRALDAAATGEDRGAVFDALADDGSRAGLVVERDGVLTGSALRSRWGLGPSVVATTPEAGLALLATLRRVPGDPLTVSLPDGNLEAARTLHAWGLQPVNQARRMSLGPPPAYDPARVFGLFNLFWG